MFLSFSYYLSRTLFLLILNLMKKRISEKYFFSLVTSSDVTSVEAILSSQPHLVHTKDPEGWTGLLRAAGGC